MQYRIRIYFTANALDRYKLSIKERPIPVTVKDAVALTEASPSTISRACKGYPSISRQTKEKVRQAIAELGCEPGFQASSLATQGSRTIGIISPPSEWEAYQNTFYLEVIHGISQYCNQRQYINTVITRQGKEEILQVIKNMVRTGLTEGFIILYSREQDPMLDYLYEEGILYVLVGRTYRDVNRTTYVDNDSMLVGKGTAEYLLELGHGRIAYPSGNRSLLFNNDRRMGHMLALTERGIGFLPGLCVEVPSVPERQSEVLHALLTRTDRPTTALVSDDIPAVALEKGCMGLGPSMSGDVSIVSFDNSLLVRLTVPSLTSVDVNSCQLGTQTAAQMIGHMENPELVATKIIVLHHLVEQDSCAVYKRP